MQNPWNLWKVAAFLVAMPLTMYVMTHLDDVIITVWTLTTWMTREDYEKGIEERKKRDSAPCQNVLSESVPIASIERWNPTEWWFAFGFGWISSDMRYYAYEDLGNDSYKLTSVPALWTEIRESDSERPAINRYGQVGNCQWFRFGKFEMVVPKGAVRKNFQP